MWKSLIFGCALLALGGVAQAEMTARHNFVAFETVESALEGAKADELVRLTGHIVSEPSDGVYVFEDSSGRLFMAIPQEMRPEMTIRRGVTYEVLGRVSRLPFEGLRVDAESIKVVSQ